MKMKRTNRKLSEATKQKIANSLRGRKKTESHIQAISIGMKRYWETIPEEINNESVNPLIDATI